MDEAAMRAGLDGCLVRLANGRVDLAAWKSLPDPFPVWRRAS
jgi:hypothetical protein